MAMPSASGAGDAKLRRSRRLSSTRGLRVATDPDRKLTRPEDDWAARGRGSLDGDTISNGPSKPGLELLNVSGFDRKRAPENVLRSDSKYEIGLPTSHVPGKSLRHDFCTMRKRKDRPEVQQGDSIAKRLEVIRELNRKILANYEKFQARSRRPLRKDERVCDNDEVLYAEVKKRTRSRQEQKSQGESRNFLTSDKSRTNYDNGSKKSLKKIQNKTTSCDANENFSLSVRTSFPRQDEGDLRERITRAAYCVQTKTESKTAFRELTNVFEKSRKDECLSNSRLYPEPCTMGRKHLKDWKEGPDENCWKNFQSKDWEHLGPICSVRGGAHVSPAANEKVVESSEESCKRFRGDYLKVQVNGTADRSSREYLERRTSDYLNSIARQKFEEKHEENTEEFKNDCSSRTVCGKVDENSGQDCNGFTCDYSNSKEFKGVHTNLGNMQDTKIHVLLSSRTSTSTGENMSSNNCSKSLLKTDSENFEELKTIHSDSNVTKSVLKNPEKSQDATKSFGMISKISLRREKNVAPITSPKILLKSAKENLKEPKDVYSDPEVSKSAVEKDGKLQGTVTSVSKDTRSSSCPGKDLLPNSSPKILLKRTEENREEHRSDSLAPEVSQSTVENLEKIQATSTSIPKIGRTSPGAGEDASPILATLNATIERYDVDNSSLDESFSSDSIARTPGYRRRRRRRDSSFEASWDSGLGVDAVGTGSGWIRVHTGIESSLVYLTLDTTAKDVCRDMLLADDFALYVQYGGEIGRRLLQEEKPLELQDFFLQQIGYSEVAKRARLGVDPELRHLIAFHVGPAAPLPDLCGHSRCGQALVLKGLVFPQWKRRPLAVLGSRLFLYPACSSSEPEWIELSGGAVCNAPTRLGKLVLRVTGHPRVTRPVIDAHQAQQEHAEQEPHHPETRHLYLGFQHPWDRDLWRSWLKQSTQLPCSPRRLDLSRGGLSRIPDSCIAFPAIEEILLGQNRLAGPDSNLAILRRFPRLQTVHLPCNDLPGIPRELLGLEGLTCLDLSDNKIEEISRDINRLVNLKELILDRNALKDLPDELGHLKSLQSLSLAGNRLSRAPGFLNMRALALPEVLSKNDHGKSYKDERNNQNNLQKINLRNNQLKGSIILGNYGNLTHLDVSENSIEKLDISALHELRSVRCARNLLVELTVCGRNLTSLIAGNNRLEKLTIEPVPVGLEHFDVSYNDLDSLPEWISDLPALRALFASHNGLTSLPDRLLAQPARLEVLHLPHNRLQALPPPRRPLNLVHLTLQGNALTVLPAGFFANTDKLRVLNLSNNRLSELPYALDQDGTGGRRHSLEKLYLTANCLTDTALDALAKFTGLRTLHLAYNTLDTLPESCIASWGDLEELVLSGNRLQYLPDNVANLRHLRVLRVHSNRLLTCPTFNKTASLKVLDLAHNQLDRIDLTALVPSQLQFLDVSCNARLHVDPRQFQAYRTRRPVSLVDVSGQNRPCLPSRPRRDAVATETSGVEQPWRLGFSETAGTREKLCVSQIRLANFGSSEGLFGIFDGGPNQDPPFGDLQETLPRLLLEERTSRESSKDYLKYALLSAQRVFRERGEKCGVEATLLHVVGSQGEYPEHQPRRFVLRVACAGESRAVLCRAAGPLVLAPSRRPFALPAASYAMLPGQGGPFAPFPEPVCEEVGLEDDDEFVVVANRRLWEVLSVQEAVREARAESSPVLAAKRLQDLAQAYGAEDNLSVIVLRLAGPARARNDVEMLMKELRDAVGRNRAKSDGNNCTCPCCVPREAHKPPGACCCHATGEFYVNGVLKNIVNRSGKPHNNSGRYLKNCRGSQEASENAICRDDRSSPSGQSDQASDSTFKSRQTSGRKWTGSAASRAASKSRQVLESGSARKFPPTADDGSGASCLSEEQFRCWEYMLEQNTQLLFDKELDTLARAPLRRGQSRSTPQLAAGAPPPFLSKRFGSARSFDPAPLPIPARFAGGRRNALNGGPNAAYFGSLQRLMPYNLEYDFAVIQERGAGLDSLEQDPTRMQQYWGVATTEL